MQSILTTLFCCLPFGIISIIYASQVNGKVAQGDIPGATDASNKAKMWCWLSFGFGIVIGLFYFLAALASAGSGATN